MKLKYQILQGTKVLSEGVGRDLPHINGDLVITCEQAFELVTGLRLQLMEEQEEFANVHGEFATLKEVVESQSDPIPGIASTSLTDELHSDDTVRVESPFQPDRKNG